MADNSITINLKQGSGKTFPVTISLSSTILQLKEKCEQISQVPCPQQKYIFKGLQAFYQIQIKGKILKDTDLLSSLNIEEGMTICFVAYKLKAAEPNQQAKQNPQPEIQQSIPRSNPTKGFGNIDPNIDPYSLNSIIQIPENKEMIQQLIQNPQMIQQMIASNPTLQQMVQSNPELAMIMNNPALIKMYGQILTTQGFGGLLDQMPQGAQQQQQPSQQQNPYGLDLNALMAGFDGMRMGGGLPGVGATGVNQPAPQLNLSPEERYKDQLLQMQEMGFTNKEVNLEALTATNGNVQVAVERLLNMLG